MVCATSKNIKLFRLLYKKATGNYGEIPEVVSSGWTDLKVTTGPSDLSIEDQEVTLPNYGESLRDDYTQHAYRKVSGGTVVTPHHVTFAEHHEALLKSGFGKLTAASGSGALSAEATDTCRLVLGAGEGSGFVAGQMIKIGTDRLAVVLSIDTDTLSISSDIPVSVTYPAETTVVGVDYWDPQCLDDNNYFHALVWDADEYWAIDYFKPSFSMESNDGGVPKQWSIGLSAYSARRLTGADKTTAIAAFAATSTEPFTIATLNNKVNLNIESVPVYDVSMISMEIERDNTRWETGVNACGAIGSTNDITSITGSVSVFTNKDEYHSYVTGNEEVSVGWQSPDANFAVYAPAVKFTRAGENPIAEENSQNIAVFGLSFNEAQDETIKMYLGDL